MEGTVFTFWYSTTRFTNSPLLSLLVTAVKLAGDSGWSLSFPGSLLYDSCVISQQHPARAQRSPQSGSHNSCP